MDQPPATRRRFRFGLRTLLMVVTPAAVGSWAYWFGWPWWVNYRERAQFVASVKQVKAGMTIYHGLELTDIEKHAERTQIVGKFDPKIRPVMCFFYSWANAEYCVRFVGTSWEQTPEYLHVDVYSPLILFEVFRLPPMPSDYQGQGYDGPRLVALWGSHQYLADFAEFLYSDRKHNPGFQYKLIYSDPPAKPEAK
jgi:hypothetical protein